MKPENIELKQPTGSQSESEIVILNNHYWLCWIDIEAIIDPGTDEARKYGTEAAHWLTVTILNTDFE